MPTRTARAAIAAAVGVRKSVSADRGRSSAQLADKRVLLLLDNFKHLTAAAALLPELMTACPRVKILVTRRVALHMRGEYEFPWRRSPCPAAIRRRRWSN